MNWKKSGHKRALPALHRADHLASSYKEKGRKKSSVCWASAFPSANDNTPQLTCENPRLRRVTFSHWAMFCLRLLKHIWLIRLSEIVSPHFLYPKSPALMHTHSYLVPAA
jgi:hypothetical protein